MMDVIVSIGGLSEQSPVRTARIRDRRDDPPENTAQDAVDISKAAREAAGATRLLVQAPREPDIREQRVEEAKASIQEGVYRVQNVVRYVAACISRYI